MFVFYLLYDLVYYCVVEIMRTSVILTVTMGPETLVSVKQINIHDLEPETWFNF